MNDERRLTELTRDEAMRLLATVSLGRVVFTERALPAVRPVNHLVDESGVIIRSHVGSAIVAIAGRTEGAVVAYEADEIDPSSHVGWSVVVTGVARLVSDQIEVARYEQMLRPWLAGNMEYVIRIIPELVTGFRLDERGRAFA
jgi:nitroimidazol reductase NimA-like FMN-containing flavoprotein (pyridoxamine 5'-phosphate oxidase superfamily)